MVLLQELRGGTVNEIEADWAGPSVFSVDVHPPANRRWMSTAVLLPEGSDVLTSGVVEGLPRPQRATWVRARLDDKREATFVSWHCEHAAGGDDMRLRKMEAYIAMSRWVRDAPPPIILGADLNTWQDPIELRAADPDHTHTEEHEFVGAAPQHGLVDAYRQVLKDRNGLDEVRRLRPDGPLAVSYVLDSGAQHRFDRIYVSPGVHAKDAGYEFEAALAAGSDHALHWAELTW